MASGSCDFERPFSLLLPNNIPQVRIIGEGGGMNVNRLTVSQRFTAVQKGTHRIQVFCQQYVAVPDKRHFLLMSQWQNKLAARLASRDGCRDRAGDRAQRPG